jgi:hypothetical protein
MTVAARQERYVLTLVDRRRAGPLIECEVTLNHVGERRTLQVTLVDGTQVAEATSPVDFEEALTALRATLDGKDLLLLCNRYRIDAFASSLSRQMSDGLACYIVERNRPVAPELTVESLAPAPPEKVSTRADADRFMADWIASFDA